MTVRSSRPVLAFARTTLLTGVAGDGASSANTGIASISIKQKRIDTFANLRKRLNFDGNILGKLGWPKSDRAAWILVGGRSSRMGADKAHALSGGRALALRVADRAAQVCNSIFAVGDPVKYADLGLPVIADSRPGSGPLAAIETALAVSENEANLILACDMPALGENLLEELFEAGGDITVPRHDSGEIEPLCAVYGRRCLPLVREALDSGIRSVTEALRRFPPRCEVRYVRVADPAAFANLNTPEDWRRYHHG
jgi:molybdopterin-guanine dinucleotide biosynthesis protein A